MIFGQFLGQSALHFALLTKWTGYFVIFTVFIRCLCAGYKLTAAGAQKRFPLLMPTLDGLTKYAHLIDVDYFADLLQVSHSFSNLHAHTHDVVVIGLVYMAYPNGC